MTNYLFQIKLLAKRLLIVYLMYFFCRLFFYIANRGSFQSVGAGTFVLDSIFGLRFDTFSIFVSNALFILLSIVPSRAFFSSWYQSILKWIFILFNALFLLVNCVDIGYFAYIKKRSGADLFNQVGGQTDMGTLLPRYLRDFWWVLLIYVALLFLLVLLYRRIKIRYQPVTENLPLKRQLALGLSFLFLAALVVLGIRGGFQRIPIDIVDAGGMASPEETPIVLNTPFTIIKSLDKECLAEYDFFRKEELKKVFDPVHHFQDRTFKKENVVVILLESFAKEYTKLGGRKSYTPFLDSLMQHSLIFANAWSNGAKSIEGIPAILSSLPSMMENPVINSAYSNNRQTSFATVLQHEGYGSAFFHGGTNGTMNFDAYAKLAGYQQYFGRTEYGNDADFDGSWGIWDEPFLQFTVRKLSEFSEPFHAAIFTLSSHHPYGIPAQHKGRFPKGHLENSESVGYADYALKRFFEAASRCSWYRNTLFVLAADHASISDDRFYNTFAGQKTIPVLFFRPDHSLARRCDSSFSQIDILPSALHVMGYSKPFFSLGQSFLKRTNNNCYFYDSGNYYVVSDTLIARFSGCDLQALYNLRRDSSFTANAMEQYPGESARLRKELMAFLQTYNHVLIANEGTVEMFN